MASKGFLVVVTLLGIAVALPIWRGAGHSRHDGVTFSELLFDSTHLTPESPFGHPHLPYDEAVRRAQEAYNRIKGGG